MRCSSPSQYRLHPCLGSLSCTCQFLKLIILQYVKETPHSKCHHRWRYSTTNNSSDHIREIINKTSSNDLQAVGYGWFEKVWVRYGGTSNTILRVLSVKGRGVPPISVITFSPIFFVCTGGKGAPKICNLSF